MRNRAAWDVYAEGYVEPGERAWASDEVRWGIWGVPESELRLLPDDLAGKDVIELGCGTAYVGSWLARRGARVTGIDSSPRQLATARRLQGVHGVQFPLLLGNAESVPLPAASFDLAISEYGAAVWCDPYRWIPEAARLLRVGGELMFLSGSAMFMCFAPDEEGVAATECLVRPYFGMHRFEWPDDGSVEFRLPHGEMLRLLHRSGFEVLDLVEIQAPDGATTSYPYVTPGWARQWPSEEAWKARKVR